MAKKKKFDDPLKDVDPVMEDAFSKTEPDTAESAKVTVSDVEFPAFSQPVEGSPLSGDIFNQINVDVSVELGRSKVSLQEVYELTEGAIIELERLVGEPLDLMVNGQVVAQGEVVAIDNRYGLRLTHIVAKTPG